MSTIALQGLNTQTQTAGSTAQDNNALFASLVEEYARDIYRYAYWLTSNREVAEDLVQETMLRAWKSVHKLNDTKAVKSWLFTIVRRENARRFERKQAEISDQPVDNIEENHRDYDTSTEAFVLRQAIEKLPVEYREPLLLQVVHGFSQKDIAAHLGVSVAGAGTRLFRARQKLREMIA